MAAASGCAANVRLRDVPVPEAAWAYVREGIAPGGTQANWRFLDDWVQYDDGVDKPAQLVLCDAQTSGGLLIAVAPDDADALCSALRARNALSAAVIGTLETGRAGHMRVER
jgi:selenide,water dikinase